MKLRSRRQIEWIVGFTLALMCACLVTTPAHAQSDRGLLWDYAAGDRVNTVDVSADGERMAIGARDNVVSMLDADGALLWTFTADNSVLGLDLSPDGRWLAVASEDRQVYLLDGDGNRLWQFKAQRPMNNAAVADDGSLVAATSNDLSVYALDDAGELLWEEPLGIGVQAVAIYGKGDKARVIVGSDDGLVTIYSRDGNTLLREQLDYDVRSLDVTPSGGRILVGTSDGMASLLNGSNGDILWQFDTDTDSNDISVALAADGQIGRRRRTGDGLSAGRRRPADPNVRPGRRCARRSHHRRRRPPGSRHVGCAQRSLRPRGRCRRIGQGPIRSVSG